MLLADRYRIERELGSGGMATVYLAHDVRHDRKVALKVLKPDLAAVIGAGRFLAEIRTTANLQHPHILPLHDSGEAEGTVFYVMPFIDGESLRDRLTREKQLPIADATRIATAVADALQYAHVHGVIHRDIKPENILLQNGHALVADFGIALAASSAGTRMTETGMSLGTPHYMSPEQAMGERDLDARTDVYALGCVLYEMLSGQPPFTGPTAQAIVAKVITEAPVPLSRLRSTVSEDLEAAVLTALEKVPADRFASAAAFGAALDGSAPVKTSARRGSRAPSRQRIPWRTVSFVLAGIAVASMAFAAWTLRPGDTGSTELISYDAALPDTAMMTFFDAAGMTGYGAPLTSVSVSPDGAFAVYPALRGDSTVLWYRSLRDGSGGPIPGTAGAMVPKISPDGSRVAFISANRVLVVPFAGGVPKQLLVAGLLPQLAWISPTRLIVTHTDGGRISIVDVESGPVSERTIARCQFARWIEEEEKLLCGATIIDPVSGEQQPLVARPADGSGGNRLQGADYRVVDRRYLVYLSGEGELHAAAYDPDRRLVGRGVTLVTGIRREATGVGQFEISKSGDLVFAPGANADVATIVVLRPNARPVPLPVEPAVFQRFDLSRDGRWLAAAVQAERGVELRIYNLKNGQSFVWFRSQGIRHALWNPDGNRLLFLASDSLGAAILSGSPRTSAPPDTVMADKSSSTLPDVMDYVDDNTVVGSNFNSGAVLRFDPASRPARAEQVLADARFTTIAPDKKRIAYQTPDGRIMVTAYPTPGEIVQVARGVEPLWLSASELVYRSGVSWYSVRIDASGESPGSAVLFGRDPRFVDTSGWSNRLSHDGGIIYLQGPEQSTARYLRVIPNWVSRMKAAVDSADGRR